MERFVRDIYKLLARGPPRGERTVSRAPTGVNAVGGISAMKLPVSAGIESGGHSGYRGEEYRVVVAVAQNVRTSKIGSHFLVLPVALRPPTACSSRWPSRYRAC